MNKKHEIRVCRKGERYGEPGEVIEVIHRVLRVECIGNFVPVFCTYKGKRMLVQSEAGDISDPFRANVTYLDSLYIEV